jgi:signal transduction histidine kinase
VQRTQRGHNPCDPAFPADPALNSPEIATSSSQRVLREHLSSVYASRMAGVCGHLCFTFIGGAMGYFYLHLPFVLPFVSLLVCVNLYVLLSPRWHAGVSLADSHRWARRHTLQMVLIGAATAPVPWFFVSTQNPEVTALVAILIMVGCGLAMQSLWPMKASLFGYGIPMMGGLIGALLWHSDGVNLFLAAIGTAYLLFALRRGVLQNRQLTDALILRFENESLAGRLGEQIAATERASVEKTRFLAAASHDLRQPLHAIALFGAALQNALHDHPERPNAERLMRAVNALGSSLDTMLDVSRLDAGVITPDIRPVRVDALLVSLNHVFLARAEEAGLQLRVQASGLWVRSDPQLLQRMLSNLVDNALKYTVRGGVIVRARARARAEGRAALRTAAVRLPVGRRRQRARRGPAPERAQRHADAAAPDHRRDRARAPAARAGIGSGRAFQAGRCGQAPARHRCGARWCLSRRRRAPGRVEAGGLIAPIRRRKRLNPRARKRRTVNGRARPVRLPHAATLERHRPENRPSRAPWR